MNGLGTFSRLALVASLTLSYAAAVFADDGLEDVRDTLTDVEGTSIHANEEEPRVLHIVPWQPPTLRRRDRQALSLPGTEELLRPIDVEAFRTHRHFRQTLDVLNVDRNGP
jgi:hypothetical protein